MPWHVPFHRVEAAAAAAKASSGAAPRQQGSASAAHSLPQPASHQLAADPAVADVEAPVPLQKAEHMEATQTKLEGSASGPSTSGKAPLSASGTCVDGPDAKEVFLDGQVDEAKRTVVFRRYYHLYDKGELESLIEQVEGIKLQSSFYDKSNWCAIFEKA